VPRRVQPLPPIESAVAGDPATPDWDRVQLPPAWPDRISIRDPRSLWRLARHLARGPEPVRLPPGLPGGDGLPGYVLQEFHRLPNGNYSRVFANGYARWFDAVMLGRLRPARRRVARRLAGARAALDVGCGSGALAAELARAGIVDVWGLDPSPYLLQVAARLHPGIRFIQGLAERTCFPDARFDAAAACFLFHELPPGAAERSLDELHRILAPGGLLGVVEPSAPQRQPRSALRLLRDEGLMGLYFRVLARFVYEPYVDAWHERDVRDSLDRRGFDLVEDEVRFPFRFVVARRR
jgi:ubiquinone/menaquinone biosynthesis C-methylase UbiE